MIRHFAVALTVGLLAMPLEVFAGQGDKTAPAPRRPKLEFNKTQPKFEKFQTRGMLASPETTARNFLDGYAKDKSIDVRTLAEPTQAETLRGTTFVFQQRLNNLKVFGSHIRLHVREDGDVDQVFDNLATEPTGKTLQSTPKIASDEAVIDKVWQHLKAGGELKAGHSIVLGYFPQGDDLKLSYEVLLTVTQPLGSWRCYVDATSGEIIDPGPGRADTEGINCENTMAPGAKREELPNPNRTMGDREAAFAEYSRREKRRIADRSLEPKTGDEKLVGGTATLVDPDPRTALMDENLSAENADPDRLEPAYQTKTMPQVTKRGSTHHLEGPWVKMSDWDPPVSAPPVSPDGHWGFRVGEAVFSDVMAYFHIDRSQRYLQSIGFTGNRAIQGDPIHVDANAEDNKDNSHFWLQTNTLTFGKGCAADAEDSDVILHEYGHALTHAVMKHAGSEWSGGDSKAIGEAFGDYWAATSRVSTTHQGAKFRSDRVFNWDASCGWPGRGLNADAAVVSYDPDCTYPDHRKKVTCVKGGKKTTVQLGGDYVTEELFSAPLFQAFRTLTRDKPDRRGEVDRIILNAMSGLVSGFTMRDFASLIVHEAGELYPGRPHKAVFEGEFRRFGILEAAAESKSDDDTEPSPAPVAEAPAPMPIVTAAAPAPVSAQEAPPRALKAEPFDPAAPDIAAFRGRGEAKSGKAQSLIDSLGVPEDQMFAIINPEKRAASAKHGGGGDDAKTAAAEAVQCDVEMVEWDPSGMRGWFQVNYGEPCNLVQYCNWIRDPKTDTDEDIRAQEAELEQKWEEAPAEEKRALEDNPAKFSPTAEDGETPDVHLNHYNQIEREVILGGTRKCRLTRQCTGKDDPLCTKEFLDQKAAQIEIEQLGK